jgi:hypothetical protein
MELSGQLDSPVVIFDFDPDSSESATPALRRILERLPDGACLEFKPGVYHFHGMGASRRHLWLSNNHSGERAVVFDLIDRHRITINGGGARFVFHGAILPFVIDLKEYGVLSVFSEITLNKT